MSTLTPPFDANRILRPVDSSVRLIAETVSSSSRTAARYASASAKRCSTSNGNACVGPWAVNISFLNSNGSCTMGHRLSSLCAVRRKPFSPMPSQIEQPLAAVLTSRTTAIVSNEVCNRGSEVGTVNHGNDETRKERNLGFSHFGTLLHPLHTTCHAGYLTYLHNMDSQVTILGLHPKTFLSGDIAFQLFTLDPKATLSWLAGVIIATFVLHNV